jgi:hypothetical protein
MDQQVTKYGRASDGSIQKLSLGTLESLRQKSPVKIAIQTSKVSFAYSGPDGSQTTDNALKLALRISNQANQANK